GRRVAGDEPGMEVHRPVVVAPLLTDLGGAGGVRATRHGRYQPPSRLLAVSRGSTSPTSLCRMRRRACAIASGMSSCGAVGNAVHSVRKSSIHDRPDGRWTCLASTIGETRSEEHTSEL